MSYKCRIYTPEFKAKLDKEIDEEANRRITEGDDKASYFRSFEILRIRDSFNLMFNKLEAFKDYPEVIEHYKSIGLYPAEYTEIILEKADRGYQSRPRVEWNGKIEKIDEIDEILSYVTVQESTCAE